MMGVDPSDEEILVTSFGALTAAPLHELTLWELKTICEAYALTRNVRSEVPIYRVRRVLVNDPRFYVDGDVVTLG